MKWEQRQEKSRGKVTAAKKVRWMGSKNVGENFYPTPYNWGRWYWSDYCICRNSDRSLPGWYSTVPEYLKFQFQKSVLFDIYQLQPSSDGFLQYFIWRDDHLFALYGNRSNKNIDPQGVKGAAPCSNAPGSCSGDLNNLPKNCDPYSRCKRLKRGEH